MENKMGRTIKMSGTLRFKDDNGAFSEYPVSRKAPLEVPYEVYQIISSLFMSGKEEAPAAPAAPQASESVQTSPFSNQ
jgi:hypothetical protein